jgi:hypothetical protein
MLKYQSCALLLKCRCRFTSVIGLIMQHPILSVSVISAVYRLWGHCARALARTRQRQVGPPHCASPSSLASTLYHRLLPPSTCLSRLSPLQSLTLSYTKPKYRLGLFMSRCRSPSLMPATWLLSDLYRLTPSTTTITPLVPTPPPLR